MRNKTEVLRESNVPAESTGWVAQQQKVGKASKTQNIRLRESWPRMATTIIEVKIQLKNITKPTKTKNGLAHSSST